MGIFDRFRRKNQDSSVLPAEVNEYYQSEQRERRGVALLLGTITLVVTLLVATGLFFGGRYAFRKITDNDKSASQTTTNSGKQGAGKQDGTSSPGDPAKDNSAGSAATPSPSTSTPSSNPAPTSGSTATPRAGDDQPPASSLPRTGDEGM